MSEKGGTLFLIAIVVVLAGVLLSTVTSPMFEESLWAINTFFDEMLWSTLLEYPE